MESLTYYTLESLERRRKRKIVQYLGIPNNWLKYFCSLTEKPSTKLQPETVTVKEGENDTLFCNSSGSTLTITWKFNGIDVTTSGDSRISFSDGNRHLIITNVSRVNKGEYKCVASNKVGNDTSNTAFVLVECKYRANVPGRFNLLAVLKFLFSCLAWLEMIVKRLHS